MGVERFPTGGHHAPARPPGSFAMVGERGTPSGTNMYTLRLDTTEDSLPLASYAAHEDSQQEPPDIR